MGNFVQAFQEGYIAYYNGIDEEHNPYAAGTDENRAWTNGYKAARASSALKRFET